MLCDLSPVDFVDVKPFGAIAGATDEPEVAFGPCAALGPHPGRSREAARTTRLADMDFPDARVLCGGGRAEIQRRRHGEDIEFARGMLQAVATRFDGGM